MRERLLDWQDRLGVDVMPLLFACWFPGLRSTAQWNATIQESREWNRRVTRRIRALRRRLPRAAWPEGHQACLALELGAERLEARWLTRRDCGQRQSAASSANLRLRLARLFLELPMADIDLLLATLPERYHPPPEPASE